MSDATLLIKKMPSDLKDWLAAEAQRNHRSMNKETIRLLEEARSLRDKADKPARDKVRVIPARNVARHAEKKSGGAMGIMEKSLLL